MTASNESLDDLTRQGYEIVHRDREGVQVRKRKSWSWVGLLVFVLLPLLLGFLWPGFWFFGAAALLVNVVLYLMAKDELLYIAAKSRALNIVDISQPELTSDGKVICPNCGRANSRSAPTCRECGAQFAGQVA